MDFIDGPSLEPPAPELPWWAAGTCDHCLEPTDVLQRDGRGNKLCGGCHPGMTEGLCPGIHRAPPSRSAATEAIEPHDHQDDFGDEIPF